MKSESLVIADQQAAGNTFPGLVHTAVTPWELVATDVPMQIEMKLGLGTGVKS